MTPLWEGPSPGVAPGGAGDEGFCWLLNVGAEAPTPKDKEPGSRPGRDKFRPASTKRGESGSKAAALQKKNRLSRGSVYFGGGLRRIIARWLLK